MTVCLLFNVFQIYAILLPFCNISSLIVLLKGIADDSIKVDILGEVVEVRTRVWSSLSFIFFNCGMFFFVSVCQG